MSESVENLAAVLLRGRVTMVRDRIESVQSAAVVLLRVPLSNAGLARAAADDLEKSLNALSDSVSRLLAGFD